jgi:hypothetical protein
MVIEQRVHLTDSVSPFAEPAPRPPALVPRQIPWGYGRDRVTAIAVDPLQLFVYWELKDETLEHARAQIGGDAAVVLRVFDTSGRIFDGTNAHSSFDQDVHRNDRQWFCTVGKPGSSAHVEMGLRARDGRFLRLVRSGRVDFPRNSPASGQPLEWMRVVPQSGQIEGREIPAPPWHADQPPPGYAGPPPAPGPGSASDGQHHEHVLTDGRTELYEQTPAFEHYSQEGWEIFEREALRFESDSGWQIDEHDPSLSYRMVSLRWEEFGIGTSRWETGAVESAWQAGPFNYPTEVITPAVEHFEGPRMVFRTGGAVRVLHGPWQVVIRGINAHAERRVLERWEVHRTWGTASVPNKNGLNGLSLGTGQPVGASERLAFSASERRLGGASERQVGGSSERRVGGASERAPFGTPPSSKKH